MKTTIAKFLVRAVGTLAGLLGIGMLAVASAMIPRVTALQNPMMILIALFPLGLAIYLLYVAYLVWRRFSPLAVQHVCGLLALYALTFPLKLIEVTKDTDATWPVFVFVGCIIAAYFAYRLGSARLNRFLFSQRTAEVLP